LSCPQSSHERHPERNIPAENAKNDSLNGEFVIHRTEEITQRRDKRKNSQYKEKQLE
jgi:hypothetical protein